MKTTIVATLILITGLITFIVWPNPKNANMTFRQRVTKVFYPFIMKMSKTTVLTNIGEHQKKPVVDFYSLSVTLNDGSTFDFASLKGKKVILVNTASDCGFTAQYEALEALYQQQKDSVVIIGFPANDFGNQEKYTNDKIAVFCKKNYGVTFPLAEKSVVIKKDSQEKVYQWLTDPSLNGWNNQAPTWNFCKYLIDEKGTLIGFYNSGVQPADVLK